MYEFVETRLPIADRMIQRAWSRLSQIITRKVEHHDLWHNNTVAAMTRGQIVVLSYNPGAPEDNAVVLATAAAGPPTDVGVRFAGVVQPASIPAGAKGNFATDGVRLVRMVTQLVPNEGDFVYISETEAGAGTTAAPDGIGEWVCKIGVIVDASPYVDAVGQRFVWVLLNNMCIAPNVLG